MSVSDLQFLQQECAGDFATLRAVPAFLFQLRDGVCGEFQICRIDPADIQVLARLC